MARSREEPLQPGDSPLETCPLCLQTLACIASWPHPAEGKQTLVLTRGGDPRAETAGVVGESVESA